MEMERVIWQLLMIIVTQFQYSETSQQVAQSTTSSFATKVDFATGSTPISVAIGDIGWRWKE